MQYYDPAVFGQALNEKLAKFASTHDVEKFADLVMGRTFSAPSATNIPTGGVVQPHINMLQALDKKEAVEAMGEGALGGACARAPIVIAIAGETHRKTADAERSLKLLVRLNAQSSPEEILALEERGLKNMANNGVLANFLYANEISLTGNAFSEPQRSVIMAAYCCLCLAGGDQSKKSRVLILVGDNHVDDILEAFEYIILNSEQITWLKLRTRVYHVLRTQA